MVSSDDGKGGSALHPMSSFREVGSCFLLNISSFGTEHKEVKDDLRFDTPSNPCYHIDVFKIIYGKEHPVSIDCVAFCRALADDTRQQILAMLLQQEMCVGDIVKEFDMSQPTISHHLSILKQSALVTSRKEGKQVYYAINRDNVVECCGMLMSKFEAEGACEA